MSERQYSTSLREMAINFFAIARDFCVGVLGSSLQFVVVANRTAELGRQLEVAGTMTGCNTRISQVFPADDMKIRSASELDEGLQCERF